MPGEKMGSPNARRRRRAEDPAMRENGVVAAAAEDGKVQEKKKKKKSRTRNGLSRVRRKLMCFGCGSYGGRPEVDGGGAGVEKLASERAGGRNGRLPTHLVVMVHGIIGSAGDWRFAAKRFAKELPEDVIVHRSKCNSNILTLKGVDRMGERLAKEVSEFIQGRPELKNISFIGHSLGGLVSRYAIARLYEATSPQESFSRNVNDKDLGIDTESSEEKPRGKIAGLQPMNFITVATPHLGSRWHRQVPLFCGFRLLENMAIHSSCVLGRTGKHLFLTDGNEGKPPLLLQMTNDSDDLPFLSALQCFRRKVAYANVCSDYIVGRKTSMICHQDELPKRDAFTKNHKYPHIVLVEAPKFVSVDHSISYDLTTKTSDIQEQMILGLNKVAWERVHVSFHKCIQRFLAHNTIQVKTYYLNSHGADVISHMIDNFLR